MSRGICVFMFPHVYEKNRGGLQKPEGGLFELTKSHIFTGFTPLRSVQQLNKTCAFFRGLFRKKIQLQSTLYLPSQLEIPDISFVAKSFFVELGDPFWIYSRARIPGQIKVQRIFSSRNLIILVTVTGKALYIIQSILIFCCIKTWVFFRKRIGKNMWKDYLQPSQISYNAMAFGCLGWKEFFFRQRMEKRWLKIDE